MPNEWMQGYPPGFITDHADRKAAIRIAGNIAVPQQVAAAIVHLSTTLGLDLSERAEVTR